MDGERPREVDEDRERRIPEPSFNAADVGVVQARAEGEFLERKAPSVPKAADGLAQLCTDIHAHNAGPCGSVRHGI